MEVERKHLEKLVGNNKLKIFDAICKYINQNYEMDCEFNYAGKKWDYEYKFRKSNKTLCGFYFKENCLGFMVILGKVEREKFEQNKENYSRYLCDLYDETKTYHDGKWLMLEIIDLSLFEDIKKLLYIKRKPNIKK